MRRPKFDKYDIQPRLHKMFYWILTENKDSIKIKDLKNELPKFNINPKLIFWINDCFGGIAIFNVENLRTIDINKFRKRYTNFTNETDNLVYTLYEFLFNYGNVTKKHLEFYNNENIMYETNENIETKTDLVEAPETNVTKEPFEFKEYIPKEKPTHVKPAFYAFLYESLKIIAKEYGYNLLLNGSMNRDLDLVAIPWINEPKDEYEMIKHFDMEINGFHQEVYHGSEKCDINSNRYKQLVYIYSTLPGGRKSYVININRSGEWNNWNDEQYYLDISVTPFINDSKLI